MMMILEVDIIFTMGYNQSCTFQNCTYKCCNFNGDCPEWYSNSKWEYTECYYYYGIDPNVLLWTTVCTFVVAFALIIIAVCCYREFKQKQQALEKQDKSFQISNTTIQTKPDIVGIGKPDDVNFEPQFNQKYKIQHEPVVPYGLPVRLSQTGPIYGIGASINKET